MADFLFHKVSEKEKEEIRKESRKILDSFSKKLANVKDKGKAVKNPEEIDFERVEKDDKSKADFSREIMFENAPKKNKDFIIAEKGRW